MKQELVKKEQDSIIVQSDLDVQISTAKHYSRDVTECIKRAEDMVTSSQSIAENCFYSLKRGGKIIEGPGVRLAEILSSCWGNMRIESRVTEITEKHVVAQATCWDLESNLMIRIETKRRITDSNGNRYNDDMIVMTGNAACAIALRNALFKVVPYAYVSQLCEKAKKVAVGETSSIVKRFEKAVSWFQKSGVDESRILIALGKTDKNQITTDDIVHLTGIKTALSEGTTTIEEQFPIVITNGKHSFGFKKKKEIVDVEAVSEVPEEEVKNMLNAMKEEK